MKVTTAMREGARTRLGEGPGTQRGTERMLQIAHLSGYLWPCQVSGGRAGVMAALGVISPCWLFTPLLSAKPDPSPLTVVPL